LQGTNALAYRILRTKKFYNIGPGLDLHLAIGAADVNAADDLLQKDDGQQQVQVSKSKNLFFLFTDVGTNKLECLSSKAVAYLQTLH
jgi:hypothetical protein